MKHSTLSKLFAVGLSLAMAVTSAPMPAVAVGPSAPAFAAKLTPPENFGYVASSYDSGNGQLPRLVVIADLHGHVGVQKNIMGIMDSLVSRLGNEKAANPSGFVPIFVEGGWTPGLEEPLRSVKNSKVRSIMADYFLHKAEIGAAQAFSEQHVGAKNISLTGVENQKEYEANRARFTETYPARKKVLEAIARQMDSLDVIRQNVASSSAKHLFNARLDYEKGKITVDRYAKMLLKHARRFGLKNAMVRTLENRNQENPGKVELALTEVHRQVSVKLAGSKPLTSYIRQIHPKEDVLRANLAEVDSMLDLLRRTVANQLTPDEVAYALANLGRLTNVAQMILGGEKLGFDLEATIRHSLNFYPFAFLRDETLVRNSLAALNKDARHPSTGILVVGGFHAEAIAKYLRDNRQSYLLINPIVDRDITATEQLNYVKRICKEHVTGLEAKEDFSKPWGRSLISNPLAMGPVNGLATPAVTPAGTPGTTGTDIVTPVAGPVAEAVTGTPKEGTPTTPTEATKEDDNKAQSLTAATHTEDEAVVMSAMYHGMATTNAQEFEAAAGKKVLYHMDINVVNGQQDAESVARAKAAMTKHHVSGTIDASRAVDVDLSELDSNSELGVSMDFLMRQMKEEGVNTGAAKKVRFQVIKNLRTQGEIYDKTSVGALSLKSRGKSVTVQHRAIILGSSEEETVVGIGEEQYEQLMKAHSKEDVKTMAQDLVAAAGTITDSKKKAAEDFFGAIYQAFHETVHGVHAEGRSEAKTIAYSALKTVEYAVEMSGEAVAFQDLALGVMNIVGRTLPTDIARGLRTQLENGSITDIQGLARVLANEIRPEVLDTPRVQAAMKNLIENHVALDEAAAEKMAKRWVNEAAAMGDNLDPNDKERLGDIVEQKEKEASAIQETKEGNA